MINGREAIFTKVSPLHSAPLRLSSVSRNLLSIIFELWTRLKWQVTMDEWIADDFDAGDIESFNFTDLILSINRFSRFHWIFHFIQLIIPQLKCHIISCTTQLPCRWLRSSVSARQFTVIKCEKYDYNLSINLQCCLKF